MRILFIGDSITDAGRDRRNYHDLGSGYARCAAEILKAEFPQKDLEFINMGISANRTGLFRPSPRQRTWIQLVLILKNRPVPTSRKIRM